MRFFRLIDSCKSISEIKPEDLDKIKKAKIIRYFDYLKAHIKLSTLQTKKNQLGSFWQYLQDDHYCNLLEVRD